MRVARRFFSPPVIFDPAGRLRSSPGNVIDQRLHPVDVAQDRGEARLPEGLVAEVDV